MTVDDVCDLGERKKEGEEKRGRGEGERESRMEGRRKERRGIWVGTRATSVTMTTKKIHTNQM